MGKIKGWEGTTWGRMSLQKRELVEPHHLSRAAARAITAARLPRSPGFAAVSIGAGSGQPRPPRCGAPDGVGYPARLCQLPQPMMFGPSWPALPNLKQRSESGSNRGLNPAKTEV